MYIIYILLYIIHDIESNLQASSTSIVYMVRAVSERRPLFRVNFLGQIRLIVQGIFAKIGPDLELCGGDLISSPVEGIVSPVSPKRSSGPNSVGKDYFSATPFSLLAKNATGGHNA